MKYNPQIHHRRSIRLRGYDYSQAGAYFITICCNNRLLRFGTITEIDQDCSDVQIELNEFGQIAYNEWVKLPERFSNVELDVFQIMPNHMHGIIVLNTVGATLAVASNNMVNNGAVAPNNTVNNNAVVDNRAGSGNRVGPGSGNSNRVGASPTPTDAAAGNDINHNATIGGIVGAYKSLVANGCLDLFKCSIKTGAKHEYEMMGKLWQRNYHEHIILMSSLIKISLRT